MAQEVSRQPVTEEAKIHSQVSPCEIYGGHCHTGTGFSPRTLVFPCQYHSTSTLPSLRLHVVPTRTKQAKPGSLPKNQVSSRIQGSFGRKTLSLFLVFIWLTTKVTNLNFSTVVHRRWATIPQATG